ncbi:hypothetical protein Tco_0451961 [Tanacetum coccineum]
MTFSLINKVYELNFQQSTNKSRVSIVDDDARTKDSAQLETPISESDKENVDVIGSTSSRKDTRNGKYATEISVFEGSSLNEGHKQIHEPTTYLEVVKDSRWVDAMNQEMEALNRNKT